MKPARPRTAIRRLLVVVIILLMLIASVVWAHPEDEFCVPGEDGMDPALCDALSVLDSSDPDAMRRLEPLLDEFGNVRGFWSTAGLYVTIGVRHILPDGSDHILFVLAIFLASTRLRALVIQVSTFTVAHTATLGLAASGMITPTAAIVEPLIALTIGFVALENLFFRDMTRWRPLLVFGFGLIHGMGFAGFFGELGLPPGQFWSALIGFNVGVEIGQIAVILVAFAAAIALRRMWADDADRRYRRFVVLPASALIGFVGFAWAIQRFIGA